MDRDGSTATRPNVPIGPTYLQSVFSNSEVAYNGINGATPRQNFELVFVLETLLQHTGAQVFS